MVKFDNNIMCVAELCREKNLNYGTILTRLNRYGYTIEEAVRMGTKKGFVERVYIKRTYNKLTNNAMEKKDENN